MTILDELAQSARIRVEKDKKFLSEDAIRSQALTLPKGDFEFEKALKKQDIAFICECKKASPSKGIIAHNFPYLDIAKEYEQAGADCISVLTEPTRFLGSDLFLKEIAASVKIPCIRKDFIVDEYMIYQAKLLGAKAVLLICSILDGKQIAQYINICDGLGISALTEVHDEKEIKIAINAGARIIGVNNRNLKDFTVNPDNSRRMRELVPENIIFVSESGVKTSEDIDLLRKIGADAVLIGETLMKSGDKKQKLKQLRGKI